MHFFLHQAEPPRFYLAQIIHNKSKYIHKLRFCRWSRHFSNQSCCFLRCCRCTCYKNLATQVHFMETHMMYRKVLLYQNLPSWATASVDVSKSHIMKRRFSHSHPDVLSQTFHSCQRQPSLCVSLWNGPSNGIRHFITLTLFLVSLDKPSRPTVLEHLISSYACSSSSTGIFSALQKLWMCLLSGCGSSYDVMVFFVFVLCFFKNLFIFLPHFTPLCPFIAWHLSSWA